MSPESLWDQGWTWSITCCRQYWWNVSYHCFANTENKTFYLKRTEALRLRAAIVVFHLLFWLCIGPCGLSSSILEKSVISIGDKNVVLNQLSLIKSDIWKETHLKGHMGIREIAAGIKKIILYLEPLLFGLLWHTPVSRSCFFVFSASEAWSVLTSTSRTLTWTSVRLETAGLRIHTSATAPAWR